MQETTSHIIDVLQGEKDNKIKGGLYHRLMIDLTYNSNHIEGSKLTEEDTRYIFETRSVGLGDRAIPVDDIIETVNHFRAVDFIIEHVREPLSEPMIKYIHGIIKQGTLQSQNPRFAVGDYKRIANIVGDVETCPPEKVKGMMDTLLRQYAEKEIKTLDDILDFHVRFERIHPFQDGNGRVGRLIMFKECLDNDVVPFIIRDELKLYYYRGLKNWPDIPGYLRDTCLTGQDYMRGLLEYFQIPVSPEEEPSKGYDPWN